jgi:2'-5' RNA ligase
MSRAPTARLFAAIDPPEDVREALADWGRRACSALEPGAPGAGRRTLRVLDPELIHLTLCFLGNRPVAELDSLAAALAADGEDLPELSLGAPLWLPPRRPGALAVEVRDELGGLPRLQAGLVRDLAAAGGWEPERRRFRAHMTVARVRGGRGRRGGPRLGQPLTVATPRLTFMPLSLSLYRSWLSPSGPRYEAIATRPLAAAGP